MENMEDLIWQYLNLLNQLIITRQFIFTEMVNQKEILLMPADAPDLSARVRLLMAALDPCVPFEIAAPVVHDRGMETQHA